jgi:serine/threonine-protein kinase PknK
VRFDRRVAVKVLGRLISDSDRRRFDAECRIMGRLSSHPNVVTVHSAGYTDDGKPYLLMELVEGGTLADRLTADGQVPWPGALDIIRPIADAVGRAHEAGILHRDIKPENILIAGDQPSLTDFGIAYLRDATGATSTHITASWYHTDPETFSSNRDERSDLYSLAQLAYRLSTCSFRQPIEPPRRRALRPGTPVSPVRPGSGPTPPWPARPRVRVRHADRCAASAGGSIVEGNSSRFFR